jgi:hypothetical protein
MFAPLVAKAKTTEPQRSKAAAQGPKPYSADPAHVSQRSIGDQASFVAPQASQISDALRGQGIDPVFAVRGRRPRLLDDKSVAAAMREAPYMPTTLR